MHAQSLAWKYFIALERLFSVSIRRTSGVDDKMPCLLSFDAELLPDEVDTAEDGPR